MSKVADGWRISNTPYCCVGTFRYSKGGIYPAPGSHADLSAAADAAAAHDSENLTPSAAQTPSPEKTTATNVATATNHVTTTSALAAATAASTPRWKTIQLQDLVPFNVEDLQSDKDSSGSGDDSVSPSLADDYAGVDA